MGLTQLCTGLQSNNDSTNNDGKNRCNEMHANIDQVLCSKNERNRTLKCSNPQQGGSHYLSYVTNNMCDIGVFVTNRIPHW